MDFHSVLALTDRPVVDIKIGAHYATLYISNRRIGTLKSPLASSDAETAAKVGHAAIIKWSAIMAEKSTSQIFVNIHEHALQFRAARAAGSSA